ncbi:MAG: hypothetical protein FWG14_07975 [Peptococcaceae bacterium]|nr:hypothetical protein [Peptococcaceae bacterium]
MDNMEHYLMIRMFGLLIISFYVYKKILNMKNVSKLKIAFAILFSLIMSVPLSYFPPLYEFIFVISVFVFVAITSRVKLPLMITAVIISVGISLGIDILADLIISFIEYPILIVNYSAKLIQEYGIANVIQDNIPLEDLKNIVLLVNSDPSWNPLLSIPLIVTESISLIMNAVLVVLFFRIKRLRPGFVFLHNKEARWIGIVFSVLIMAIRSFWGENTSIALGVFLVVLTIICIIGINFWWRHNTTMLYQQRLKDRTIQEQQGEIDEKNKQNESLATCNKFLSETVHRDNKLIPAMYTAVGTFLNTSDKNIEAETKRKGMQILSELDEMMRERKEMILKIQREHKPLTSTGMERVDNILNYMCMKAAKNGIQFDFVMTGNVKDSAESVIPKQQLVTLLADLIENAIIAVTLTPQVHLTLQASDSTHKKILVTMGIAEDCYEITVQDSGIPFEMETLMDLGLKKSTTHADQGGSGIGYLTIFKILDESRGSLAIVEHEPAKNTFSKSIKVRFDGKSEFVIYSYRAEIIKSFSKRSGNHFTVKGDPAKTPEETRQVGRDPNAGTA